MNTFLFLLMSTPFFGGDSIVKEPEPDPCSILKSRYEYRFGDAVSCINANDHPNICNQLVAEAIALAGLYYDCIAEHY